MSKVSDIVKYRELGSIATSLKLEALKRRAMNPQSDEERWSMILAYHSAAQHELSRLALVSDPSPATEARARIEAAALFRDSGDPVSAEDQRKVLFAISDALGGPEKAFLARIEREFKTFTKQSTPILVGIQRQDPGRGVGTKVIKKLLVKYPGTAMLWEMLHLLAVKSRNRREARSAVSRARELNPDDPFPAYLDIMQSAAFLPIKNPMEAADEARKIRSEWREVSGEVNHAFVVAMARIFPVTMKRWLLKEVYDALLQVRRLGAFGMAPDSPDLDVKIDSTIAAVGDLLATPADQPDADARRVPHVIEVEDRAQVRGTEPTEDVGVTSLRASDSNFPDNYVMDHWLQRRRGSQESRR